MRRSHFVERFKIANIPNILSIATSTGCDGVHPGYGFLAENADFAELCEACQLKFIGPSYQSIQKMGIKDVAKAEMIKANVPVVPGSDGLMKDVSEAKKIAKKIGYPVIIKATAGGGAILVLLVMKNLKLASE